MYFSDLIRAKYPTWYTKEIIDITSKDLARKTYKKYLSTSTASIIFYC